MGIDLSLADVRGIVLSQGTLEQLAERFDIEYDEGDTWELAEEISSNFKTISISQAVDSWSGDVYIPYLAINRLTKKHEARSASAGIYALSDKPFRLKPEEADEIKSLLTGTDDEGAEIQTFVAWSIT